MLISLSLGFSASRSRLGLLLLLASTAPGLARGGPGRKSAPTGVDTVRVNRLNDLAERTAEQKNVQQGWQYATQARALAQRSGYLRGELNSIRIMANLAIPCGKYSNAIRYNNEGIALAQANRQHGFYEPFYASLGACAVDMEQYAYAVKVLQTSLKYRRLYPPSSPDSALSRAQTLTHLAKAQMELGLVKAAMESCRLTFPAGTRAPSYPDVEVIMAELLRGRASSESALVHLRSALARYRKRGDRHKESLTLLTLSRFLAEQDLPAEAGQSAASAQVLGRQLRAVPIQMKALEYQAQAAVAQKDYRRAYELLHQASQRKDELFNQEKSRELQKQQVQFNIEKLEQRNQSLTRVNEANRERATAEQNKVQTLRYLLGASFVFLVVGSFIYWRLRRKRAQLGHVYDKLHQRQEELEESKQKLEESNLKLGEKVVEKEVLVQEIHHRVKNNLQLVSSLLGWQSSTYPDPALVEALACSQARIQSMALVHELLYSADNLAEVGLDKYICTLLTTLGKSFNSAKCPVAISTALQPLAMTAQQAIPFGLLVNELVTNAYKHAFVGRSSGRMHVELREGPQGAGFELVVLDDGVGMPEPTAARRDSLGTHLMLNMARQLRADLVIEANEPAGTRVVLRRAFDLSPNGQPLPLLRGEAVLA